MIKKQSLSRSPLRILVLSLMVASIFQAGIVSASPDPRIINGNDASEGAWPWMAIIVYAGKDPAQNYFICGGSLISPQFVLTAAHCVSDPSFYSGIRVDDPSKIETIIGVTTLSNQNGVRVGVEEIIVHPDYDVNTSNDIALLRLKEPVNLRAVSVIQAGEEMLWAAGQEVTLMGWGQTDPYYSVHPDTMQQAQVPIIADSACRSTYGLGFNPQTMLCAGVLSGNPSVAIDTCYGDSGGPVVVQDGATWKQVGIVSWGNECAHDRFPGVYTRVAAYSTWISDILNTNIRVGNLLDGLLDDVKAATVRLPKIPDNYASSHEYTDFERTVNRIANAKETALRHAGELLLLVKTEGRVVRQTYPNFTRKNVARIHRSVSTLCARRSSAGKKKQLRKLKAMIARVSRLRS